MKRFLLNRTGVNPALPEDTGKPHERVSNTLSIKDDSSLMMCGFPRKFVPLLRCPIDSGELSVNQEARGDEDSIVDGSIRCGICSGQYEIENGIVRLMKDSVTQEVEHEGALKDYEYAKMPEVFEPPSSGWRSEFMDRIEIPPHLSAVQPLEGRMVLELGCGDGRFTILMAQQGANILAVDISIEGLRKVQSNYIAGTAPTTYKVARQGRIVGCVGLAKADASAFHVAPRSFDRALSATPLDLRDERMKMYSAVAESLTDDGRYVASVEYDDLCYRFLGLPLVHRYSPGGILIEHIDIPTMRREIAPFFGRTRMRPIRAFLPFVKRLRLPTAIRVAAARACCALPGFRHLGTILLVYAERPIRIPVEGVWRRGYFGIWSLYCRYKRKRGEEATFYGNEPIDFSERPVCQQQREKGAVQSSNAQLCKMHLCDHLLMSSICDQCNTILNPEKED